MDEWLPMRGYFSLMILGASGYIFCFIYSQIFLTYPSNATIQDLIALANTAQIINLVSFLSFFSFMVGSIGSIYSLNEQSMIALREKEIVSDEKDKSKITRVRCPKCQAFEDFTNLKKPFEMICSCCGTRLKSSSNTEEPEKNDSPEKR